MNWFCSCKPKPKETIQSYNIINSSNLSKAYPKTHDEVEVARATAEETIANIKKETERLKPRIQITQSQSKDGYYSIKQFKQKDAPNTIFRKIQKSNYEEILRKCEKSKEKWTDPDFDYSIGGDIAQWKRIGDIIPKASFMSCPIKPNEILQGRINDCYLLSAIAVIAERDYRIKNIFGSLEANKYGVYMCKLTYDGIYQEVVVDDFFPLDKEGGFISSKLYQGTDFWVMILEKCWAKIFGTYDKTNYGFNIESQRALTGAPTLGEFDTNDYVCETTLSRQLFQKLLAHYNLNHLLTCSVNRSNGFKLAEFNLHESHSYSILGIFQTANEFGDKVRLLQIRNPYGFSAPSLPYSVNDSFWKKITPHEKDRLEFWRIQSQGKDGIFYVDWQTFILLFNQIAICQLDDNANYIYDNVTIKSGEPTFVSLAVQSNANFHFIISQKSIRKKNKAVADYANLRVLVAGVKTNFKNQQEYEYICSKSYTSSIYSSDMDVDLGSLQPGKYVIRIFTYMDSSEVDMVFGYYSPGDFSVKYLKGVDDDEFVSKTLLNRARNIDSKSNMKRQLQNAKGWCCIENIYESNICYIAYHVDSSSQSEKYTIDLNETDNVSQFNGQDCTMYFEGPPKWSGETVITQPIKRGEEVIIPYTYTVWLVNQDLVPSIIDTRKLPIPVFKAV